MNRIPRYAALAACLLALSACASLGLAPAEKFSGRLVYGYATYTGVNNSIASSLDAHRISSADAKQFREVAQNGRALVDAADLAFRAGDLADATKRLELALVVLDELTRYIDSRSKP